MALPDWWQAAAIVTLLALLLWGVYLERSLPSVRVPRATDAAAAELLLPGEHVVTNAPIAFEGMWYPQPLDTVTSLATDEAGGNLRFRFHGTRVSLTMRVGPEAGRAYVLIDGQPVDGLNSDEQGSYVSLYASKAADRPIELASDLTHTEHEIIISNGEQGQLAISAVDIDAQTPFPWVFAFFYTGILISLYLVLRSVAYKIFARLGWGPADTPTPPGASW